MAILRLSTGLRNAILDAVLNAGTTGLLNSGILEIRDGSQPAAANDAPTGSVLCSITLPADAFGAAASGACAKAGTWQDASADASGTATWARLKKSGDGGGSSTTDLRMDMDVTNNAGSGALKLDSTSITAGGTVTVSTFTITQPAS